ncbi:MAG TPA: hypothetical protein PLN21_12330 [Gemmatales bacterium]|nr:hypothetical protein [Gemmatales bacterium]
MMALLALLLLQAPASESKLIVSKVRPTLVDLGPARPDASYLPGDVMHVTFDVAGFALDPDGLYKYSAKLSVEDSAGKVIGSEDYGNGPARLGVLGNGKSRFSFQLPIPTDQAPGNYKAKLVMGDANAKGTVTIEQAYKVVSPAFGFVRLQTGRGPFGRSPTPCSGNVGEALAFGFQLVGISKGKDNNGNVDLTVEVQDSQGKTLGKPQVSSFTNINATEPLSLTFEVPLDQAGQYKVVFKAMDKSNSRSATMTVPIMVIE